MSISRWLMPVQSDVAQALVPDASAFVVGQAILPAAAFQAALSGRVRAFAPGKGRLKAGCSQDWLPHSLLGA
jgi:hypothetical protein